MRPELVLRRRDLVEDGHVDMLQDKIDQGYEKVRTVQGIKKILKGGGEGLRWRRETGRTRADRRGEDEGDGCILDSFPELRVEAAEDDTSVDDIHTKTGSSICQFTGINEMPWRNDGLRQRN